MRILAALAPALILTGALVLAGCGSSTPQPHALSQEQAELLAMARFTNYDHQVVGFRGQVPTAAGPLDLVGRVDYVRGIGYGTLRTEGGAGYGSAGVLQWNSAALAFLAGAGRADDTPPVGQWQLRPLQAPGGELDTALALLLALGSDRPDNPQILRQSDARWLRTDTVDGRAVDVFEGPRTADSRDASAPRLRYWLAETGELLRIEARIGAAGTDASFDLTSGAAPFEALADLSR
jgi:hypothetical protein